MELRADAARNRAAIVEAARQAFAEHGLDVTTDEIALRAGTGNATLYRRFPTRSDLVAAVFAERMTEHLNAVQAALADPDPWAGFCAYINAATTLQARDRGIADLVTMDVSTAPEIERLRRFAFDGLVQLVERAQTVGALRTDFTTQDVVLVLMANAGLVERADGISVAASARLVHLLLDGLRTGAATPGPPATSVRLTRLAMRRNGERRLGTRRTTTPRTHQEPTR